SAHHGRRQDGLRRHALTRTPASGRWLRQRRYRSRRSEHLTPAEEGSIDADVLEPIELAGKRILGEHDHIRHLAGLERSESVLVKGQAMAALDGDAQRLLSRQPNLAEASLTILVPACNRLPRGPQQGIGAPVV